MQYKETRYKELKREYSKSFLKTVSAFANLGDGEIIFGVSDQGFVVGVEDILSLRLNLEHAINDAIIPRPFYEVEVDDTVLILRIYKGEHTPYEYQGKAYTRRDTSTVKVDREQYQNLILEGRNQSYEDLKALSQELTFSTLESNLRKTLKLSSMTDNILRTLNLMNGSYNNAAALLSDKNPIDYAYIQLLAFASDNFDRITDQRKADGSLLLQYQYCLDFYQKHINYGSTIEGAYRIDIEEVPLIAYREAVANALIHRDYGVAAFTKVEFYLDRIEIISVGSLLNGISESDFKLGKLSKLRNRTLASVFNKLGIIEKFATGIRRIKEQYKDYPVKPEMIVTEKSVIVILPKITADNNIPMVRERSIHEKELLLYNMIKKEPRIKRSALQKHIYLEKSQTIEILNSLILKGLIIKVGNGPATGYIVR